MWYIWLLLSGIFLIIEIITVGFLVFWLSIAALLTMVVSLFTSNIIIQIVVFVITSALLMFFTKPLVKKFANTKTINTNAKGVIGKTGIVNIEIDPNKGLGQVIIEGQFWSAKSTNEKIIKKNTEVKILKIEGVKVLVEEIF